MTDRVDGSRLAPSPKQLIEDLERRVAALEERVRQLEADAEAERGYRMEQRERNPEGR